MCKNCFECKNSEIAFKDVMKIDKDLLKNIEIVKRESSNDFER